MLDYCHHHFLQNMFYFNIHQLAHHQHYIHMIQCINRGNHTITVFITHILQTVHTTVIFIVISAPHSNMFWPLYMVIFMQFHQKTLGSCCIFYSKHVAFWFGYSPSNFTWNGSRWPNSFAKTVTIIYILK